MAYNWDARGLRQCTARKRDGRPCRGWAVWGDHGQRCRSHGGQSPTIGEPGKTRYQTCNCDAYPFVHRPGSGLCLWPHKPEYAWRPIEGLRPKRGAHEPWPATIEVADL